jgi:hypothetical protein
MRARSAQLFIRVGSVHVRGVEERDAKLKRAMNSAERLFVIASTVKIGHSDAAETDPPKPPGRRVQVFAVSCL